MNPRLERLQPYPFERLRTLLSGVRPPPDLAPILLSIGEPRHPTPPFICQALADNLAGLSAYPATLGREELRRAIAAWLKLRYRLNTIDPQTQVLPTLGSREALFAIAQVVLDPGETDARVVCPNPFYQIYEGAALLGGATPHFINVTADTDFRVDYGRIPAAVWQHTRLVFACSPGNPTGSVMTLDDWRSLFELSDRHGFVIVADECYSEIYFDNSAVPLGALEAAQKLGRGDFRNLVAMGSLSKRSNVPGMRSGFAAGDAEIMRRFAHYRTYHGSAMSLAVQAASQVAWEDEAHVLENRRLYREKFNAFRTIVDPVMPLRMPAASFYFWAQTPIPDTEFAVRLFHDTHITVLPGSLLAREVDGVNPGANHVRIALVGSLAETLEAADRLHDFVARL